MSGGADKIQPLTLDVSKLERPDTARRLRNEFGVNSPKSGEHSARSERGRGTGTPVGPEARREAAERNKYNVNSPRAKGKRSSYPDGNSGSPPQSSGGLQALVTQVPRNEPSPPPATNQSPPGPQHLLTQVERPKTSSGQDAPSGQPTQLEPIEIESREQPPPKQSCWADLFCCCRAPPPSPPQQHHQAAASNDRTPASTGAKVHPVPTKPAPKQEYDNREAGQTNASTEGVLQTKSSETPDKAAEQEMPTVEQVDGVQDAHEENSYSGPDPDGYLGPNKSGHKRCLVLDLDETLVHSSFKAPGLGDPRPDFIVPVVIDGVTHQVYVGKRPFCDEFLIECAKHWEVVIFTASLSKYADPLLDMLDKTSVIRGRLFREHCVLHGGNYVKDLTKLGRKLKNLVIIDNAPKSYLFQPNNAVNITSWFDDKNDTELLDCIPVLTTTLLECEDVRDVLDANNKSFRWLCRQARQKQ